MTPSLKKRFWKTVTVADSDNGFCVLLDGRRINTPAKSTLEVPTEGLAEVIAAEWQAQEGDIDPSTMPMTRRANAAIDKVAVQHLEVAEMLAEYGDSDLLCYRAESPKKLTDRQALAWDPVLAWAAAEFQAPLTVTSGVMHVGQNPQALKYLSEPIFEMPAFILTAFHDLVTLSGSLVLALAAIREFDAIDNIWTLSRVDELWQEELWGPDEEATRMASVKRQDFLDAFRFLCLAKAE